MTASAALGERAVAETGSWYDAHTGSVVAPPPTPPEQVKHVSRSDNHDDLAVIIARLLRADDDHSGGEDVLSGGVVQSALEVASPGATIRLSDGQLPGPLLASTSVVIEGAGRDASWLVATDGPALLIDGGDVTIRGMTIGTVHGRAAVMVQAGSLRLVDCVLAGEVGVMIGRGAGSVTLEASRIVCSQGGCGVMTGSVAPLTLDGVEVAVHHGIGLLRLGETGAAPTGLSVVGDAVTRTHDHHG
ncbi:MAG TPA: hypothetical protein VGT61_13610 [Thermomicrobiales bacterium]|jgi:hypothetical protein|nr:hypothetical protein [Thermomicrobiales bacterium]